MKWLLKLSRFLEGLHYELNSYERGYIVTEQLNAPQAGYPGQISKWGMGAGNYCEGQILVDEGTFFRVLRVMNREPTA